MRLKWTQNMTNKKQKWSIIDHNFIDYYLCSQLKVSCEKGHKMYVKVGQILMLQTFMNVTENAYF